MAEEPKEFEERVIQVNRVSKKTKGGNKIGFSVLVVVGNRKGKVGLALAKAPDVVSGIKKAIRLAKKRAIEIPLYKKTIPHGIQVKKGAAKVLLKPAPEGTGIIAGGAIRELADLAGVENLVAKVLGSDNKINNLYAAFEGLQSLKERKGRLPRR